jgi:hypothetical protein
MRGADRKAALAAYKEQKIDAGIYAVRCSPANRIWVGSAPNLDAIWNRLSFGLRQGGHRGRSLQAAWNEHGADGFSFEVLERIEEEKDRYLQASILKEKLAGWQAELKAEPVL